MSSVIRPTPTPSPAPVAGAWRALLAWLGEGAWMLGAFILAVALVALFVLVVELPTIEGAFGDALTTPVNLTRIAVLASAAWLWSYIHRAIRQVPARSDRP